MIVDGGNPAEVRPQLSLMASTPTCSRASLYCGIPAAVDGYRNAPAMLELGLA